MISGCWARMSYVECLFQARVSYEIGVLGRIGRVPNVFENVWVTLVKLHRC